uniref:Uncharacterized protein n=1 Tax=Trichuris muris TaxID=70415 RepID=A0A5S6Q708_TRIMR
MSGAAELPSDDHLPTVLQHHLRRFGTSYMSLGRVQVFGFVPTSTALVNLPRQCSYPLRKQFEEVVKMRSGILLIRGPDILSNGKCHFPMPGPFALQGLDGGQAPVKIGATRKGRPLTERPKGGPVVPRLVTGGDFDFRDAQNSAVSLCRTSGNGNAIANKAAFRSGRQGRVCIHQRQWMWWVNLHCKAPPWWP